MSLSAEALAPPAATANRGQKGKGKEKAKGKEE